MDAIECIKTRMSIRKFISEPVPEDIIMSIINTAKWSPSYKNSQPWEVVVVSGAKKDQLSGLLIGMLEKGEKTVPDIPEPVSWPQQIEARIAGHMKRRSEYFGVDLNDPEVLKRAKIANFRFYGAPHGLFLFQDASLPLWSLFDIGLFAQSLMLAAHAHGIGTVPQAFLTDYSAKIKDFLGISDSKRLVLGISIGYPDLENRANSYRSDRIETDKVVKWVE
jgi:nitroreductase